MKCEKCPACRTYFNGNETESYCRIGILEDEACHDGEWYCRFNLRTIEKRLSDKDLRGNEYGKE